MLASLQIGNPARCWHGALAGSRAGFSGSLLWLQPQYFDDMDALYEQACELESAVEQAAAARAV